MYQSVALSPRAATVGGRLAHLPRSRPAFLLCRDRRRSDASAAVVASLSYDRYCPRELPLLFLMEHQRSRTGVTALCRVCGPSSGQLKGGVLSSLQVSRILSGNGLFAQRPSAMSVASVTAMRQEMIAHARRHPGQWRGRGEGKRVQLEKVIVFPELLFDRIPIVWLVLWGGGCKVLLSLNDFKKSSWMRIYRCNDTLERWMRAGGTH